MKELEIVYQVTRSIAAFPGAEPGDHVVWRPGRRFNSLILIRDVPGSLGHVLSLHPEAFEMVRGPRMEPEPTDAPDRRTSSGRRLELVR